MLHSRQAHVRAVAQAGVQDQSLSELFAPSAESACWTARQNFASRSQIDRCMVFRYCQGNKLCLLSSNHLEFDVQVDIITNVFLIRDPAQLHSIIAQFATFRLATPGELHKTLRTPGTAC